MVGDERLRTNKSYNMDLCKGLNFTKDKFQMPIIHKEDFIPSSLVGFNYGLSKKHIDGAFHFFLDDYQFQRVWKAPERYIEVLKRGEGALSPDFSLYTDMKTPLQIYNVYRSRLIGAFYQLHGIKIIPTISWSDVNSFEYCFLGVEKGSVVAISTIGVKKDKYKLLLWQNGVREMIKQIEPSAILIYGGQVDYDFGDTRVIYYKNEVTKNWTERSERNVKA